LVHHETIADVSVTTERYGPRTTVISPSARVVADFALVAADLFPAESTATTL
jgi:hypothetical protein